MIWRTITAKIAQEAADEQAAIDHRQAGACRTRRRRPPSRTPREASLQDATPALQQAQDTWFALSALDRTDARHRRAGRRTRPEPRRPGPGHQHRPRSRSSWRRRPSAPRPSRKPCRRPSRRPPTSWPSPPTSGSNASGRCGPPRAELVAANRLIADRREGLARLAGQVHAARSRLSAGDDEVTRLAQAVTQARDRAAAAESAFAVAQDSVGDLDSSESRARRGPRGGGRLLATPPKARNGELTDALRTAQSDASTLRARVDALSLGLDRQDGTQALLAAGDASARSARRSRRRLDITQGYETAIAAALGAIAEAVAMALGTRCGRGAGVVARQRQWPRRHAGPRGPLDARPARLAGPAGRRALGGRPADRAGRLAAGIGPGSGPGRGGHRPGLRRRRGRAASRTSARSPPTVT